MQVLVDIGNTRIKWALLDGGRLTETRSVVHRGDPDTALAALARAVPAGAERVLVANVAGAGMAARVRAALAGTSVEFAATTGEQLGVRCGYEDPRRLGVDRWLAVLAAHELAGGAACVVDVGTAVTFDAVDAGGQHLGGLILPGRELLAAALDRNTSDIGATPLAPTAPRGLALLGRSTAAAVGHGAMLAIAATIDRAVRTLTAALASPPRTYLTGGDAEAVLGWLETAVELRADLVLEGLALLAAEPKSR